MFPVCLLALSPQQGKTPLCNHTNEGGVVIELTNLTQKGLGGSYRRPAEEYSTAEKILTYLLHNVHIMISLYRIDGSSSQQCSPRATNIEWSTKV